MILSLTTSLVLAHVSVSSGVAAANTTQEVAFGVGHGCNGDDTFTVRIQIPAGVTSVRTLNSDFGKATVETDAVSGNVTAVTWQKTDADLLPKDTGYYKLVLRLKPPNAPFTKLFFPATQTCKSATGTLTVVEWKATTPQNPDAGMVDEPAPELFLIPARKAGWNKFTVTAAIAEADLAKYFGDAVILWRGSEAYSANATTTTQIMATSGVTKLTGGLAPSQEIWVRY